MVKGRLKVFQRNVLIEQDFVKDPNKTIKDIITDTVGKLVRILLLQDSKDFN